MEERVLGFLCEAAAGVKLMATLDDTGRLLAEVRENERGLGLLLLSCGNSSLTSVSPCRARQLGKRVLQ